GPALNWPGRIMKKPWMPRSSNMVANNSWVEMIRPKHAQLFDRLPRCRSGWSNAPLGEYLRTQAVWLRFSFRNPGRQRSGFPAHGHSIRAFFRTMGNPDELAPFSDHGSSGGLHHFFGVFAGRRPALRTGAYSAGTYLRGGIGCPCAHRSFSRYGPCSLYILNGHKFLDPLQGRTAITNAGHMLPPSFR